MDNSEIDMQQLLEWINEAYGSLAKVNAKEAILIFGKTGAGKSTLINFLIGYIFRKDQDTQEIVKVQNLKLDAPKIGQGVDSCTLVPDVYICHLGNGNIIYLIDTAGVGDSRGPTEDLYTKIALQIAVMCPVAIKAIIAVVEEAQLTTSRGSIFSEIAQTLFSICQGGDFHDSFFLFITKARWSEKKIISVLQDAKVKNGASALNPSANRQVAKKHGQVEAVISIFLSTGNIAIVDPCSDECRVRLLKMINNSKPISKSCIGKAMNSKIQTELKNILSSIALQGSGKLSEIEQHLKNILEKQNNMDIETKRVQKLEEQLKNHKDGIEEQIKEIKDKEVKIQQTKKKIEDEKKKMQAQKTDKLNNESNIKSKEQEQVKEEQAYKNSSVINVPLLVQKNQKQRQIKTLEDTINNSNSQKALAQTTINAKNAQITNYTNAITPLRSRVNNIGNDSELSSYLSTYNHCSSDLNQKRSVYSSRCNDRSNAESSLNSAKNDSSETVLFSQNYCQATVYGRVDKGTVHYHFFNYSGQQIKRIQKDGVLSNRIQVPYWAKFLLNDIKDGYWDCQTRNNNYYRICYNTPTHVLGKSSVKVYGYYRNSQQGIKKINRCQQAFNNAKSLQSTAYNQLNNSQNQFNKANNQYQTKKSQILSTLNSQISNYQSQIRSCQQTINQNQPYLNQPDMASWTASLGQLRSQLNNIINQITANDSSLQQVQQRVNQIKNLIATYRSNITQNINSINKSEVDIAKMEKQVEKYQSDILTSKSNIETQEQNIQKNAINTKLSQDQILAITTSINSNVSLIEQSLKQFYKIQATGSFNCMQFLYTLMKLESKAVDEFIIEYGKLGSLLAQCLTLKIKPEEIKKQAYSGKTTSTTKTHP